MVAEAIARPHYQEMRTGVWSYQVPISISPAAQPLDLIKYANMFHEGSLQSGISLAIQEQKLVVCFVQDDSDESSIWEGDWLQSGWVSNLLAQRAVLLRIEAGSTEAGFLSAFCPISDAPALIVIQNGQLQEQLVKGVTKEEFTNRIRKVLGAPAIPTSAPQPTDTPSQTPAAIPVDDRIDSEPSPPPDPEETRAPPPPPATSTPTSKGKQKATPTVSNNNDTASTRSAQQVAREKVRREKQQEKEELERIKARIEADKAERKAAAEARKAERERLNTSSPSLPTASTTTSTKGSRSATVSLNVRLFDGRTVRSTFPRTAKLQDEVRKWVDQEFTAQAEHSSSQHPPYIFKQIMAPLPSRELSAGEEAETLGDIDLAPSATLVLVPVKGFTEAYSGGGGSSGIVGGVAGSVTSVVGGAFGLAYSAASFVGGALGSITGLGGDGAQDDGQQGGQSGVQGGQQGRTLSGASQQPQQRDQREQQEGGIRVRTLADQRTGDVRNEQLYNGNQLNFEPRDDERRGS